MIQIEKDIFNIKEEAVDIRRQLHRIPEIGLMEYQTTSFILSFLEDLGIECEISAAGTGVIGFIKGKSEETVAFRADIDALTVEEHTGVEFCSINRGHMHACGHDGHMAIALSLAKLLSQKKGELEKGVLFIFQPAEEGPGGAEILVNSGLLERYNVKAIFGLHIYPELPEGKIGCRAGAMLAQTGEFDIYLKGKGAHGAMPHKGVDALLAAANAVMALNTVISRNLDPLEPGVLTIGKMSSGERRNIIAEEAALEGTIRAFNEETYGKIRSRLITVIEGIADTYDCTVKSEIRDMYPAVTNDSALFGLISKVIPEDDFIVIDPLTISEDFSYYQKRVPGLFFMLGSRNEEMGFTYSLHNNKFNFNEDILATGIQVMYNLYKAL